MIVIKAARAWDLEDVWDIEISNKLIQVLEENK